MTSNGQEYTVTAHRDANGTIGFLRITPPLPDFETYARIYGIAYTPPDEAERVPPPSQEDFESSLRDGATELRFYERSDETLLAIGRHVTWGLGVGDSSTIATATFIESIELAELEARREPSVILE